MATKPRKTPVAAAISAATVAHNALLPLLIGLQNLTSENQKLAGSRSAEYVRIVVGLYDNSVDRTADGVKVFGDRKTTTELKDGSKGSLIEALMARVQAEAKAEAEAVARKDGKPEAESIAAGIAAAAAAKVHVNVRSDVSRCATVYWELSNPKVREAAPKGIRAMYDVAKPKAKAEASAETVAAPKVGTALDRAAALLTEPEGLDAMLVALRGFFLKAGDSIGLARLGEVEVHLTSSSKKKSA